MIGLSERPPACPANQQTASSQHVWTTASHANMLSFKLKYYKNLVIIFIIIIMQTI